MDGVKREERGAVRERRAYTVLKRVLDLCASLLALIILSPLIAVIVLVIKLESRGPAIFSHLRPGKYGKEFRFFKFRSMYFDAEEKRADLKDMNEMEGPIFKIEDDPRITPFGRLLRRSSLDELPQLVNILRGEMSLVGPRPLVREDVEAPMNPVQNNDEEREHLYSLWAERRLEVLPGLTGLWQVSGRNELPLEGWIENDLKYVEERSFVLDLKILLKTIPVVLSGKGAL